MELLIRTGRLFRRCGSEGEWYGQYRKGARVLDAYTAIARKVLR